MATILATPARVALLGTDGGVSNNSVMQQQLIAMYQLITGFSTLILCRQRVVVLPCHQSLGK